jgi:hypothetical protein
MYQNDVFFFKLFFRLAHQNDLKHTKKLIFSKKILNFRVTWFASRSQTLFLVMQTEATRTAANTRDLMRKNNCFKFIVLFFENKYNNVCLLN